VSIAFAMNSQSAQLLWNNVEPPPLFYLDVGTEGDGPTGIKFSTNMPRQGEDDSDIKVANPLSTNEEDVEEIASPEAEPEVITSWQIGGDLDGYGKFDDSDKKNYGWEMKFMVDSQGLVFGQNRNDSKAVGAARKFYKGELTDGRMDVMVEVEGSTQKTHYTGFVLGDEFEGHFKIVTGSGRSGTLWGKVTTTELSPEKALEFKEKLVRARALHDNRSTMMT